MKPKAEGLDDIIKETVRRIKESEESSGPRGISAVKLYNELEKDKTEALLDARRQGKPIIDGQFQRIYLAMGCGNASFGGSARLSGGRTAECTTVVEGMGFPGTTFCDQVTLKLGLLKQEGLPKPDLIAGDSHACDVDHVCFFRTAGDLFNIPVFYIDIPLHQDDKPTLASISYVADQMGEFIEWAESKIPGVKYDEAKHIEMLEMEHMGHVYSREIYQLIKHVPCPIAPGEAFIRGFIGVDLSVYPNMKKAVEYARIFRDELGERVASGKGPYPEERLRLLWAGAGHSVESSKFYKLFMERKVAVPVAARGYRRQIFSKQGASWVPDYGVKLSPLQEEAALVSHDWWGGPSKRWIGNILDLARNIGAHGIIHLQVIGCTPMNSMGSVVAERAEKELGIPTLNLQVRYMDPDYMSKERFEEVVSPFIDKCFEWAIKPRTVKEGEFRDLEPWGQ